MKVVIVEADWDMRKDTQFVRSFFRQTKSVSLKVLEIDCKFKCYSFALLWLFELELCHVLRIGGDVNNRVMYYTAQYLVTADRRMHGNTHSLD